MSRGRTILVLLILAAGLGAFFYYDTYSLGPRREKAESAKGRIWTVEPKDVERVTLARKGETMRLQRTADGGWEMLEPIKTRGDRRQPGEALRVRPRSAGGGGQARGQGPGRAAGAVGGQQEPDRGLGLRPRRRQAGGHHALREHRARRDPAARRLPRPHRHRLRSAQRERHRP